MGSGIAAHLCNANVPVTLLDLSTDISTKARERIYKSRPPLSSATKAVLPSAERVTSWASPEVS